MNQIQKITYLLVFTLGVVTSFGMTASVYAGHNGTHSGPHQGGTGIFIPTKAQTGLSEDTPFDILLNVLQFIMGMVSVIAILMIVASGIFYMTSGGDQGRVDTAKKWLTFAIIGLIVSLSGFVIVATISTVLGTS